MRITDREISTLVDYCNANLGDKDLWKTPDGYPDSLALCIIDSIYSTGSHYSSVVNVIKRYEDARGGADGSRALLDSIVEAGGAKLWATDVVGNVKPAHTRPGARLKAEVVQEAAESLLELGVDTVPDLVASVSPRPQESAVHSAWKRLPSQSSGVTFNYLLILAGLPSVKPDRMVLRFLATALGESVPLDTHRAVDLMEACAERLGVGPSTLDHIAWRAASGRELVD